MSGRMWCWRIYRGGYLVLLPVLTGGCVAPQAVLLHPTCERVSRPGDGEALAFVVAVETQGLLGQQLVYEVNLHDSTDAPIRSTDGSYQDTAGTVAASRTLAVFKSPQTFEALRLSIPLDEVPSRNRDGPMWAKFRLYTASGQHLGAASCAVPPKPLILAAAPRPRQTPLPGTVVARRSVASLFAKDQSDTAQPAVRPSSGPPGPPENRPTTREHSIPGNLPIGHASAQAREPDPRVWLAAMVAFVKKNVAVLQAELARPLTPAAPTSSASEAPPTPSQGDSRPIAGSEPKLRTGGVGDGAAPTSGTHPQGGIGGRRQPDTSLSTTRPARTQPSEKRMRYVVQRGDTLSGIALRILGDADRWREIYALNEDRLLQPDLIHEGMTLWVPDEPSPPRER